jgi:hypothetical protein
MKPYPGNVIKYRGNVIKYPGNVIKYPGNVIKYHEYPGNVIKYHGNVISVSYIVDNNYFHYLMPEYLLLLITTGMNSWFYSVQSNNDIFHSCLILKFL